MRYRIRLAAFRQDPYVDPLAAPPDEVHDELHADEGVPLDFIRERLHDQLDRMLDLLNQGTEAAARERYERIRTDLLRGASPLQAFIDRPHRRQGTSSHDRWSS